jgi:hypothetical protein
MLPILLTHERRQSALADAACVLLFGATAIWLLSCCVPPAPEPPPPAAASCAEACARIGELECAPIVTDEGATCDEVCATLAAHGVGWDQPCMTAAATCPELEACNE